MVAEKLLSENGIAAATETLAAVGNGDSKESPTVAVIDTEDEPPKIEEIVTPYVLEQIIQGYNPDLTLISWKAELGSKVGDNYMSILYAVKLELKDEKRKHTGTTEALEVMLKTLPRNIYRAEMISDMNIFKVESTIYEEVLPILLETQKERGIPNEDIFSAWPKCYAVHLDGKSDFLAIENLKVSGYTMGNRVTGLDFNHCASVLSNLAKYHAISFAKFGGSYEKIMEAFPFLKNNMFEKTSKVAEVQQQFFTQSFKSLEESLKDMGEELASSRMVKVAEANVCTLLGDLTSKNVDFAVIIHGDCWVNNMMFKYNENDKELKFPVGVKFIDFQLSMATSRIIDIYYFLLKSSKLEILNEREEDLLMIYFAEFTRFAERLGINTKRKGLTWENFLKEVGTYRLYGVFMGLLLAPMLGADSADIPDMESFTKEDFENSDETVKKFYKDLTNGSVMRK